MMMMQMMMFSGGQFREGLERGCGVESTATGSGWIYVLSFHPGWGMRVLGGHDCRVWRQRLRVRGSIRGRRLGGSVIKERSVNRWWMRGWLLVAMSDDAKTRPSMDFCGWSHLQQGIGGSLTL